MAERQPEKRYINCAAELTQLIPGDRVLVAINPGLRPWCMTYGSEQLEEVNLTTSCKFIQLPRNYSDDPSGDLRVWEVPITKLKFPSEYMQIIQPNKMSREGDPNRMSRRVQQGTPEYERLKSLVDILE